MDTNSTEFSFQQNSIIATLKDHAQFIDAAIVTIEGKAQQNFTTINIVAIIAGAVNFGSLSPSQVAAAIDQNSQLLVIYAPTLLLLLAYVATVLLSVKAMSISALGTHPILVVEEEVERWENYTVSEYYKWMKKHILTYIKKTNVSRSARPISCVDHRSGLALRYLRCSCSGRLA